MSKILLILAVQKKKHSFIFKKTTDHYIVNLKPKFSLCKNDNINCGIVSGTLYV